MKYALFAIFVLSGCLFSNRKTDPENEKLPYFKYGIVGDSADGNDHFLILTSETAFSYCNGDTLVSNPPQRLIQKYHLRGDTLDFWFLTDTEDSSLETHDTYLRSSHSASWTGHWRRIGAITSNPNHAEIPEYMRTDFERRDSAYRNESMVITEDSIQLSYERTPYYLIWDLIAKLPETITYRFYGQDRTIFTKTDGAQMIFQEDPLGNMNISSSQPSDSLYVIHGTITHCPFDDTAPQWYSDFFEWPIEESPAPKWSAGALPSIRSRAASIFP
ncbi:MAG: hypothetical protein ABI036_15495 [Fibrobacteria bacterium]